MPSEGQETNVPNDPLPGSRANELVRAKRQIVVNPEPARYLNSDYVGPLFYNRFNYSLLEQDDADICLAVGVTSANPREGKTLVASNLAASFALAYRRETVIVDVNARSPKLHSLFGAPLSPGLGEALNDNAIHVTHTMIRNLYVLSAGNTKFDTLASEAVVLPGGRNKKDGVAKASIKLEHLVVFRDVIYSLKEQFGFIIVDLPSMSEPQFPVLITNHLDGLIVVVDAGRTKHQELDHLLQRVNPKHVLGFILNRAEHSR